MNERIRFRADGLKGVPVESRLVAPEPAPERRFSQTLLLGPLRLQDTVTTTESLPAEGIRAVQTGTVAAELAADAVLVDFKERISGRHAVVPVPISRLRLVQRVSKASP